MAAKLWFPDNRGRSATAVPGKSDLRDENIYSALVVAHGGSGQQLVFTNPRGQAIPQLVGSAITVAAAHHKTYTELTTNLTKAGELGASIGDAAIRSIGAQIEPAVPNPLSGGSGALPTYGATPYEVADILNKMFFRLEIAGKKQIEGQVFSFPALGGMYGSLSAVQSGIVAGIASNGIPGRGRCLRIPVMIARSDTLNGVVGVAGSSSLAFSTTSSGGQETLLYFNLLAAVRGDVR